MRAHPKYGYDMDRVPRVQCLLCKKPIGDAKFNHVATLARYGQMMFVHAACDTPLPKGKANAHSPDATR